MEAIKQACRHDLVDVIAAARITFFDEKANSIHSEMFRGAFGRIFCGPGARFGDFLDAYDQRKSVVPQVLAQIAAELELRAG